MTTTEPTTGEVFAEAQKLYDAGRAAGVFPEGTDPILIHSDDGSHWRVRIVDQDMWGQDSFLERIDWGTTSTEAIARIRAVTVTLEAMNGAQA